MKSVLIIAIGPVQDFIASARRSADLWFGSWLLSELSKEAARALVDEVGDLSALIFPAPEEELELWPHSKLNVANKIVSVVDEADVEAVAKNVEQKTRERLTDLATEAFKTVRGKFDDTIAFSQIADLLEFNWASVTFEFPSGYRTAREKAERVLAARKSLRNFAQVTWGSSNPKSSLDGARESVIPKSAKNEGEESRYKKYGTRKEEHLCGVGLMKRNGQRRRDDELGRVCSTSHVAALPLLARIADTPANHEAAETFFKVLVDLKLEEFFGKTPDDVEHPVFGKNDARLLFEERYVEFFEESELGKEKTASRRKVATAALVRFLKATADGKPPSPYYGLIHADGDGMGMAIDACNSPEKHRKISRALVGFADKVEGIVKKHDGSLVYAGGDDVLAYVPLHRAIECARDLADSFEKSLKDFPTGEGGSPTLSVGLAVSHHLDPLADALDRARRAEKVAKKVKGKNALAIIFDKRGGAETTVKGTWGDFDARLQALIGLYEKGQIPHGAAYELRDLSLRLDEEGVARRIKELMEQPDETRAGAEIEFLKAIRLEALRILKRKRDDAGKNLSVETIETLIGFLKKLRVSEFADELIIAREFDKVKRLAAPNRGKKGGGQ